MKKEALIGVQKPLLKPVPCQGVERLVVKVGRSNLSENSDGQRPLEPGKHYTLSEVKIIIFCLYFPMKIQWQNAKLQLTDKHE